MLSRSQRTRTQMEGRCVGWDKVVFVIKRSPIDTAIVSARVLHHHWQSRPAFPLFTKIEPGHRIQENTAFQKGLNFIYLTAAILTCGARLAEVSDTGGWTREMATTIIRNDSRHVITFRSRRFSNFFNTTPHLVPNLSKSVELKRREKSSMTPGKKSAFCTTSVPGVLFTGNARWVSKRVLKFDFAVANGVRAWRALV